MTLYTNPEVNLIEKKETNNWLLFASICFGTIILTFTTNNILITDEIYFDLLGDQLAYDRIINILETSKGWAWLGYVLMPLILSLKFFLSAGCILIGTLLTGYNISLSKLFRITMLSELIFFIPSIIKIFWFGFFSTEYSLQDLQYFAPFSLLSLVGQENIDKILIYPFQLVNIFEIGYWFSLAYGLTSITQTNIVKMLKLVAISYGTGLLLWVVFVIFLTLSISA
jgi:hypothetical protein